MQNSITVKEIACILKISYKIRNTFTVKDLSY